MFRFLVITLLTLSFTFSFSSKSFSQNKEVDHFEAAARSLKLRSIGPALMGGRISDIEVNPHNLSEWFVSAGSGNVWKTSNSGITWRPVFDDYNSYSIGDIAIDPNNTNVVWIGTGENVSGRHVGWGDGVYKSTDGGKNWQHMGLKNSEHIGKILIDPDNSEVVYVAAEGPLWSSGGERGVFKTTDGGKNWSLILEIDEHTGVSDMEFAPGNSNIIYAAAYQRRRHTWSLLAGGPGSGIYKTSDKGNSWSKIKNGLPTADMGKIGLGVTAADPNLVYATIESDNQNKGFYKSVDMGERWVKQSNYISGGTGPHYYQEIEVSPTNPHLIYQMDVFLHVTRDGGKSFDYLGTGREKHSDNHALWIDPNNGNHLLAGTDAGLYESFDEGSTWRHFPNLPISQFYKLSLDNSLPFYNIMGGAQDLGTLIGPSRTLITEGVRNQDWFVPLGADGYDCQYDPEDPNIAYMEIQGGELQRFNKITNEVISIKPVPAPNDPPERWNWDSPILISPHDHETLYFGSQRVWKSQDQGNSWEAISKDLTTNTNRYELEMTDKVWSIDALYDNGAMSLYATLTSISESPIQKGLIFTGSDDGLIHITEDGGDNWINSGKLNGVPERSFINDIEASTHHANTVFAAVDAHKLGDYKPYLFMSTDKGKTWKSIVGDLPEETIVWVIKQDHKDENLLFIGTEYGLYFSPNKGINWIKLDAGAPTIPFRDLELHERDNDLVGASFGRGFYILDDYSSLRDLSTIAKAKTNVMLPVRDAWWYVPSVPMQAKGMPTLGTTSFVADNPPFGAILTYYIDDLPETMKEARKQEEQSLNDNEDVPFPGWDALREESLETGPQVLLLIRDEEGQPVRWIMGNKAKGFHRTNWDLKLPAPDAIDLSTPGFVPPWAGDSEGPMAAPGTYTVSLYISHNGKLEMQGDPQSFNVKPIPQLGNQDFESIATFQKASRDLLAEISNASGMMSDAGERLRYLNEALKRTPEVTGEEFETYDNLSKDLAALRLRLYGDPIRRRLNESTFPSISSRASVSAYGHWETTQLPTETFKTNYNLAKQDFEIFEEDLEKYLAQLEVFEKKMKTLGAPFTKGRRF